MSQKQIISNFVMNSCINEIIRENPSHVPFIESDEKPKVSLAVAKSDEEPQLQPYTKQDRNLFIFLTVMVAIQCLLNIISSFIITSHDFYCENAVNAYQILMGLASIFVIINFLIIVCIKLFRKKTFAIISIILYFMIEAYLLGILDCYFETSCVRFINMILLIDFIGILLYFAFGVKNRVSLIRSIIYIIFSNILGYLLAFFSARVSIPIELYESLGGLLATTNFSFFYIWLFKMIHLKKIHNRLDLFRLKIIGGALIQIDMFFLTFFSIFFIGV